MRDSMKSDMAQIVLKSFILKEETKDMGKSDAIGKELMRNNIYFADAFNAGLFGGEVLINPNTLNEVDPAEIELEDTEMGTDEFWTKYRDVLKKALIKTDGKNYFVLLGVENQTEIHTAMPLRSLLYDTLRYAKQAKDVALEYRRQRKEGHPPKMSNAEFLSGWKYTDKLIPVITLVIYYGTEDWTGAKSLHDMFSEDIDEKILECIPDYKINLIEPNKIEDFNKFQSDFGELLKSIRYRDDEAELTKIFSEMPDVDALIIDAISYYVDDRCRLAAEPVEGGKMTMRSKAFDMAEERGMIANAVATVKNLMQEGSFSLEKACRMANISVEEYKKNTEK